MRLLSTWPMGKDLQDTFETPYGVVKFLISKTSDLTYTDLRSGWSFGFGLKDTITSHKIIRDEKEQAIKYFSGNIEFMNTAMTIIDIILQHKRPSVVDILGYKRFNPGALGPDVIITWFPEEQKNRKIDRYYASLL